MAEYDEVQKDQVLRWKARGKEKKKNTFGQLRVVMSSYG